MLAADIIRKFAESNIIISLAQDGENLNITNYSRLTDEEKHYIKCYKTELLWRLRSPEGDPDPSGYSAKLFVNGERVAIPLDQLIVEGKEIMERENIPPSKIFDTEMYAASVAVSRYDQAHREWVEEAETSCEAFTNVNAY